MASASIFLKGKPSNIPLPFLPKCSVNCLKCAAKRLFSTNLAGSKGPAGPLGGPRGGVTERVPLLAGVGGGALGGEWPYEDKAGGEPLGIGCCA